ncbi:glycoside hydrolase [Epithele typhae]|uniref:glycoside hydrolase n=1 Tax=Epithele typhae TaxID=378194 RepID=UPI002008D189|nr:glycoside hydrolase [Epithele typhae]KAH9934078.1 glycoside hydrolase [Epithele typhae]
MRLLHHPWLALMGLLVPAAVNADVLSLSTLDWRLSNKNGSIVVPAKVPSQAHLDLVEAGIITEPLLGINALGRLRRLDVHSGSDTTRGNLSHGTKALLVFYGLDTIANITVAGHEVAWVNNEFQQYVYDVTHLITAPVHGHTNLTVAFESAWTYGLNVTSRPDVEWVDIGGYLDFEFPNVRHVIRKTQSDFGWDWGPAFLPVGIFKPAYIVTLDSKSSDHTTSASHPLLASTSGPVFFEETALEISRQGQNTITQADQTADWLVNVTLAVRSVVRSHAPTVTIDIPELNITSGALSVSSIPADTSAPTFVHASFIVPADAPALWFPHTLGTPKLYNFTVTLSLARGARELHGSQWEDIDARGITPGDQWHFNVNGKAFYTVGTNIIPFDPFYARMTSAQVRWVLESAVLSGQNMLRVWGGGIYQPSDELTGGYDFYSACDELGILAWSELIFSDMMYPVNDFLLEGVDAEVRQNVRRVKKHPSNAQWAGGNEIEVIELLFLELNITNNMTHYLGEYLHDIVLAEEVGRIHGLFDYQRRSESGSYLIRYNNKTEGFIYGNTGTGTPNWDLHCRPSTMDVPRLRFVNEFGFHSMPSFYSWEEVLESPEDFSFNSTVVASRDHHPPAGGFAFPNPKANQGQAQMTRAWSSGFPPRNHRPNQTFAQWCWSTQIFQSLNMVSEIAWYRRGAGLGENNLGALVWQLNDIWQGVSWSSIEYSGRWKTLEVMVVSDRWDAVSGEAQMTWYDWAGEELNSSTVPFEIAPNASEVFMLVNVSAEVDGKTVTQEQVIEVVARQSYLHPLREGRRRALYVARPSGRYGWILPGDEDGNLLNGFYLIPGIDRTVQFVLNPTLSKISNPDPATFVVRSLWNNTHL